MGVNPSTIRVDANASIEYFEIYKVQMNYLCLDQIQIIAIALNP